MLKLFIILHEASGTDTDTSYTDTDTFNITTNEMMQSVNDGHPKLLLNALG